MLSVIHSNIFIVVLLFLIVVLKFLLWFPTCLCTQCTQSVHCCSWLSFAASNSILSQHSQLPNLPFLAIVRIPVSNRTHAVPSVISTVHYRTPKFSVADVLLLRTACKPKTFWHRHRQSTPGITETDEPKPRACIVEPLQGAQLRVQRLWLTCTAEAT